MKSVYHMAFKAIYKQSRFLGSLDWQSKSVLESLLILVTLAAIPLNLKNSLALINQDLCLCNGFEQENRVRLFFGLIVSS